MRELRSGGLALIIAGSPETIGLVVVTEKMVNPGEIVITPCGKRFSNGGSQRWLIHSEEICVKLSDGTVIDDYCLIFPHMLMPIDGEDFSDELQKEKELSHA